MTTERARRARWITVVRATLAIAASCLVTGGCDRPGPGAEAVPVYVGSQACASCHEKESAAWRASQHAVAMQKATPQTVLGDFGDATFTHDGVTSTFFRRDGRFFVSTDGPTGEIGEFEIPYTFGVAPLQQYLVAMPGGRLQALGIAWDSRGKEAGGDRWFHLYPGQTIRHGNPLHWTGIDQNWNYQCADCHSTNLRKNYDEKTGTFATTWSEISVGCEACHGPGSSHVAWGRLPEARRPKDPARGLTAMLDERRDAMWTFLPNHPTALRSTHRTTERDIEVCARCHARRGQFSDAFEAGQPFHDGFRPALVEPGLYHVDGQQREEVYNYGSFLQSKMSRAGVTCSDCHEPHAGRLRAPGNEMCAQCHRPEVFDTPSHHHHPAGSPGAACKGCHMPATPYMVVDPRHDHGFRIPRPDRSAALGTPDACAACHQDRDAAWIAEAMRTWYPKPRPDPRSFGDAFRAGEASAPGAREKLASVVEDGEWTPFVRASALARLGRLMAPSVVALAAESLADRNANVRMAAVGVLAGTDADTRLRLLPPMLTDASRVVRMDAARSLAGECEPRLSPPDREAFRLALAEYVDAQRFNADRPESTTNLGTLAMERGQSVEAEASLRRALALDPTFVHAAVNLADLLRGLGREQDGERVLRDALATNPGSAVVLHALGLSLARQKRMREALESLGEASRRDPDSARYAYVFGVALHDLGDPSLAMQVLESALRRHPFDRDLLFTLATYDREAGRGARAAEREALLRALEPDAFQGR